MLARSSAAWSLKTGAVVGKGSRITALKSSSCAHAIDVNRRAGAFPWGPAFRPTQHSPSRKRPTSQAWPLSLTEFTAAHQDVTDKGIQGQSDPSENRINSGSVEVVEEVDLPQIGGINERSQGNYARRGRPRKWASDAERMRAYVAKSG